MDAPANRQLNDDPTTAVPFARELARRSIAIGIGPRGTVSVRAGQVLVPVTDEGELRAVRGFVGEQDGLRLREPDGFEPGRGRRLVVEFEGRSYPIGGDGGDGDGDKGDEVARRWSVEPVDEVLGALRAAGIAARPNFVSFANGAGFVGNPGNFLPNPGNFLPNPGNFLPNPGNFLPNPGNFLPNPSPPTTLALPAPEPEHLPAPLAIPNRRAPVVLVLDTGLRTAKREAGHRPEHPWLSDHATVHAPWRDTEPGSYDDEDEADDDGSGLVDLAAGHGTFIAGIVRQHCPDAVVHVEGVLSSFGDGDDDGISTGIERAVQRIGRDEIDVVVMSFGTYTDDDTPPLMADALAAFVAPRTALVASAGNSASPRVQFPAALPNVIAVGALDAAGRAPFSNFGGWVDACAPGVAVTSTYFLDEQEPEWPKRHFEGWATWSGTSFSAPRVAAALAQHQYLHGGTAVDAWTHLSHWEKFRYPDLGIVFNLR